MPFVKGQVANPNGRPRKGTDLASALRTALGRTVDTPDGRKTNRERVVQALIEAAVEKDVAAARLLFDRSLGKLPEAVEVSGPGGKPLFDVAAFRAAYLAAKGTDDDADG